MGLRRDLHSKEIYMRKILIFVLYQNLTLTIAYLIPRLGFLTIPSIDETGIVLVVTIEKKGEWHYI